MKQFQTVKRSVALLTAASTVTAASSGIDLKDADYATIEVAIGPRLNADAEAVVIEIQESDDNVASNFAAINTVTLQRSVLPLVGSQLAIFHVNQNGTRKRFVRLFSTPETSTNSPVALTAIANVQMDQLPAGTVGQADVVAIG